jgi:hypothetical protein
MNTFYSFPPPCTFFPWQMVHHLPQRTGWLRAAFCPLCLRAPGGDARLDLSTALRVSPFAVVSGTRG